MTFTVPMLIVAMQLAAAQPKPVVPTPPPERVDIILFSDFQCPYCAQLAPAIREIQTKGIDGVQPMIVFKNFPLSIHPNSQLAHQAAMAAKEQGKFWEMHDLLFANQSKAQRSDLLEYAKRLKLDLVRFQKDLDSDRIKQLIAVDLAEGNKAGVSGTPSYTINGKMYSGTKSLPQLTELIAGDYRRSRALAEIGDSVMSKGPASAPVTLELFADLESPVSRPALEIIDQVMQRYPSTVRLQFRNFPLAFHPQAALAHEAAMTAARQGHFWEFATFILGHQDSLREQDLIALAGRLGLDEAQFADTLHAHRYAPRVEADLIAGQNRGIRGSPVILVNDKRIDGVPSVKTLTDDIDAALKAVPTTPQTIVLKQP
jgi:protein-disulfide isomerase